MAKHKKEYGPNSREEMERDEKQPVVNTGMPADRFQDKAQVSVGASNITAPSNDKLPDGDLVVKAAEEIRDKVKVRPASSTTILKDETVGGVSLDAPANPTRNAAGATDRSVVEDRSKIPYVKGGDRPDGRFERKYSDTDFLINNTICEQLAPEFDGTQPLGKSGDKVQGYLGRKQFTQARGKKNAGKRPQSTLYDRSVDFVELDSTVHTTGQVLDSCFKVERPPVTGSEAILTSGYPTVKAADSDINFEEDNGYVTGPDMLKTNYLLKSMKVVFSNGKLDSIRFNEDRLDAHASGAELDQANMNWQIDENNVAASTIKLQKELGRETTDKWSPLGYVVRQPYEYNMLAHDIEATTGALMGAAYRFDNTCLSYNANNKLRKDGAKPQQPVMDMFLNGIGTTADSTVADAVLEGGSFDDVVFNQKLYRNGSAAAMIAMFDSTKKYKTKASFFNYQKSLKFWVQQMDNNINPLHAKPEFLAALDTAHIYSTLDGSYNPMLPIFATRKVSIVNPLSLDYFASGFDRSMVGGGVKKDGDTVLGEYDEWGLKVKYSYVYSDVRNFYKQGLGHPIVAGLVRWILKHEGAWAGTFGANSETVMTCAFDALYPTLFGFLLAAASQDVLYTRAQYYRDWLFAGDQSEYIWPDLKGLDTLNFKSSSNLTIGSFKDPIVMGKMKPASAVRTFWPEYYPTLTEGTGTDNVDMLMPWFFTEQNLQATYDASRGWLNDKRQCSMSFPEVRHGVTHDCIDLLFGMDERDIRLCMDRPVALPIYRQSSGEQSDDGNIFDYLYNNDGSLDTRPAYGTATVNNKLEIGALRYDSNSDGRIVMLNKDYGANYGVSKAAVLCLPRELGFLYPNFRNSGIITEVDLSKDWDKIITSVGSYDVYAPVDGSMGYTLVSYYVRNKANSSSAFESEAISRSAALQQDYCRCFADRSSAVTGTLNANYLAKTGLVPAFTALFNANGTLLSGNTQVDTDTCMFEIGTDTPKEHKKTDHLVTFTSYEWFMLNRLFLPMNPFENCFTAVGSSDRSGAPIDPFEIAFRFGICGFFGSDFTEDVYNRSEKVLELNMYYVEDDFLKSSLALRIH